MKLLLASAGVNSTVLMHYLAKRDALAKQSGQTIVMLCDYGQASAQLQWQLLDEHAMQLGIELQLVLDRFEWPKHARKDLVPGRSLMLLLRAGLFAASHNISDIYIGSPSKVATAFNDMAEDTLLTPIRVLEPSTNWNDHSLLDTAKRLGVNLEKTYTGNDIDVIK